MQAEVCFERFYDVQKLSKHTSVRHVARFLLENTPLCSFLFSQCSKTALCGAAWQKGGPLILCTTSRVQISYCYGIIY